MANHLIRKSPLKSILKTSLPAVIDLSSQTIMWTIETILIGQISAAAFAGVGMAIQILVVCMTVLLTFIVGASLILTRHLGAGNKWQANHVLGQTVMMGFILSILLGFTWYFGAPWLLSLIREASGEARNAGVTYLSTVAFFAPIIITNFVAVGVIRGSGDTIHSMIINLTINTLNLLLAPTLIFGLFGAPRLEVFGAAIAVGISHSIGAFITTYLLRSRKMTLFLSFRELTTPNWQTFKRLFNAGLPTTVEQLAWSIGLLVVSMYAALLGVTTLAAHQVFLRIQAVLSMFYFGFGMAAMTLMGKNLGAEEKKLAQKTAEMTGWVVYIFVLIIVAFTIYFAKPIIKVFTDDPQVLKVGSTVVLAFALTQIPKAVNGVVIGNLRGAGDLKWLMWSTVAGVLFFEIGGTWASVFIFNLSLWGLWMVHMIDETTRLVLNFWRFRGGKWKFIDF